MSAQAVRALFRLELAEAIRSRWMAFTASVYGLVFAGFVWLGLRESRVLGFTGLSRVVLNIANAVVLAVPLVALVATTPTVVRARQSGFFELILTQPVRRTEWFTAAILSRWLVVVGPLAALLGGALLVGSARGGDPELATMVGKSLAVTIALAWAYVGIGFWVSTVARTPERATILALVVWVASAALHDFALVGALLRFRLAPMAVFVLAAANPVESARIAVLGSVDPQLSVLGPVGFWLANTLGEASVLAVGIGWPLALGTVAIVFASRRLRRADVVG